MSEAWKHGMNLYYSINNKCNKMFYTKYVELTEKKIPSVLFGSCLGQYHYYNMNQTIMATLQTAEREFVSKLV
ncbi:UDP-galactopyranose mutase [Pediococcus acidilactici]|uniref:UDP-galactopyranose mutase n=1 Tax=Pediococcus acidilactici TaxID=1254 RepID=UPI0039A5B9D9